MANPFSQTPRLTARIESFAYPQGKVILQDIEFMVRTSECLVILGASGAGKTTLLKILDGLLKNFRGEVYLDGLEIRKLKPKEIYSKIGLLFQNPDEQLFAPTVLEDVAFGPRNMGVNDEMVKARVVEALRLVELQGFEERPIAQLSFGQKKRVALAGLLAMGHEILLLDEPTLGLDPVREQNFLNLLLRLKAERGTTLVIATHQVDLVPYLADRVLVLSEGRVFFLGSPDILFSNYVNLEKVYLRRPLVSEALMPLYQAGLVDRLPLTVDQGKLALKRLISSVEKEAVPQPKDTRFK